MSYFDFIAFDADDTLWQNESLYANAQKKFAQLLTRYHNPEWILECLDQTEARNIQHFGYGVKSFALSMIETAVDLTEGCVSGQDIQVIVDLAKEMLNAEIQLLDHVEETIPHLAADHQLIVITKGDLLDQETKVARSGLGRFFQHIEVVSQKTPHDFKQVLKRYSIKPERFLMVGNSLRSDILPVLALGANAVHIPHELTWVHETAKPPPAGTPGFYVLKHLGQLPGLLKKIECTLK
jgi:putative hydrolase of the HAD superfamily